MVGRVEGKLPQLVVGRAPQLVVGRAPQQLVGEGSPRRQEVEMVLQAVAQGFCHCTAYHKQRTDIYFKVRLV